MSKRAIIEVVDLTSSDDVEVVPVKRRHVEVVDITALDEVEIVPVPPRVIEEVDLTIEEKDDDETVDSSGDRCYRWEVNPAHQTKEEEEDEEEEDDDSSVFTIEHYADGIEDGWAVHEMLWAESMFGGAFSPKNDDLYYTMMDSVRVNRAEDGNLWFLGENIEIPTDVFNRYREHFGDADN